jgi:hypothetical protein
LLHIHTIELGEYFADSVAGNDFFERNDVVFQAYRVALRFDDEKGDDHQYDWEQKG